MQGGRAGIRANFRESFAGRERASLGRALLGGSGTKNAELLETSMKALVSRNCAPKTCRRVSKRWVMGHASEKLVAGGFYAFARCSVRTLSSDPCGEAI